MVYRGKPSRNCYRCIARKIKCDKKVPQCSQCVRIKQPCPGYRPQADWMFLDESDNVAGKAALRKMKQNAQKPSYSSLQITASNHPYPNPLSSLDRWTEESGDDYFYSEYVFGSIGSFEYLRSFRHLADTDELIQASIRCVGLIGLSQKFRCAAATQKARQQYSTALKLTRRSLESPVLVTTDNTLLAVMLLNCFQSLVETRSDSQSHPQGNGIHMTGALELIKLRGQGQFRTYLGIRMFRQVASQVTVNCAQIGSLIPREILRLQENVIDSLTGPEKEVWRMSSIAARIVNLQAAIRQGTITGCDEVVVTASKLEGQLANLQKNLPLDFHFDTLPINGVSIYQGYIHMYPDFRVALIVNLIRACRIIANEIIIANVNNSSYRTFWQWTAAIQQMASEICATIPQQIGDLEDLVQNNDHLARKAAAYSVLWPLYVAGRCPVADDHLRSWVIGRLNYIGETFTIDNALKLARMLERRQEIGIWTAYDLLGSYARVPRVNCSDIAILDDPG